MASGTAITEETVLDAFVYWTGLPPRLADLALVAVIGRSAETVGAYIYSYILLSPDVPDEESIIIWIRTCEMRRRGDIDERTVMKHTY